MDTSSSSFGGGGNSIFVRYRVSKKTLHAATKVLSRLSQSNSSCKCQSWVQTIMAKSSKVQYTDAMHLHMTSEFEAFEFILVERKRYRNGIVSPI